MPFEKGESGNPAGRPRGARNRATLLIESLLADDAEAIGRKAVEMAKGGDLGAIRLRVEAQTGWGDDYDTGGAEGRRSSSN
jgi:hypothetical protein